MIKKRDKDNLENLSVEWIWETKSDCSWINDKTKTKIKQLTQFVTEVIPMSILSLHIQIIMIILVCTLLLITITKGLFHICIC